MTPIFWAVIGVGVFIVWAIDEARRKIERKLEMLIEEMRYPKGR